ncbi:MAG: 1,4-alpha-glucan branching protein GlgB [Actinomycetota bacterium]|nr:1,4-alpha-glucan branching protein GlgB [Actinomycetota bacterium]
MQILGDLDVHLFNEGTQTRLYDHLGAQVLPGGGAHFAVWAPNARDVAVIGDFNGWDEAAHPMFPTGSGIWKAHVPEANPGDTYKYLVTTGSGARLDKADPLAFLAEVPPKTASVVWGLDYEWGDDEWMSSRSGRQDHDAAMAIYEIHGGSWRKAANGDSLSYREMAEPLADYMIEMGYTHVEFMPLSEHPYYPSWGYQVTGYFAPTSRFGTPQDLMYLIDRLHRAGIGVILDWVPSHFATDAHGLSQFDGTALYEHADSRKGFHPDWGSFIFNYGRNEVRSFLVSSANFWLDRYHVDGLRVDGVASLLYLDYSRDEGEWEPNIYGGNENLDAISLLKQVNSVAYGEHPGITMIAEESTAFAGVSRPVDRGGLGFGYKWDMGWMHDSLEYFAHEPVHRSFHQDDLTFRMLYAYDENFILTLSHDEVVHGKGSLVNKMPGDEWQQFANLRALYGYQYALPGKKCLFMGGEFGQRSEWAVDQQLDWFVLEHGNHAGMQRWVEDLNAVYRAESSLFVKDYEPAGFEWIDAGDTGASVFSLLRKGGDRPVLVVLNLTPVTRTGYRIGVPVDGPWETLLNSDDERYWGSGAGTSGSIETGDAPVHGRAYSVALDLPPLGVLFLAPKI